MRYAYTMTVHSCLDVCVSGSRSKRTGSREVPECTPLFVSCSCLKPHSQPLSHHRDVTDFQVTFVPKLHLVTGHSLNISQDTSAQGYWTNH